MARHLTLDTTWPQADAGALPDHTTYTVVLCPDETVGDTIAADHPDTDGDAHSAFFADPTGDTDGTFYLTTPTRLAVVVHEAGHATIDTFIRHGLPIPDGDDDTAGAEEAFVHFLGMLSELLTEVANRDTILHPPDDD